MSEDFRAYGSCIHSSRMRHILQLEIRCGTFCNSTTYLSDQIHNEMRKESASYGYGCNY